MPSPLPNVRVVVRLPYNRPEEPIPNPPLVEWNSDKEHMLWDVIAKSRAVEGAATDWKGLAAHLEVPLPYLLHRAQTRYEEDLRGLQGVASPNHTFPLASPSTAHPAGTAEYFPRIPERPTLAHLNTNRLSSSSSGRGPGTPLGVRARLSSLGHGRVSSLSHQGQVRPTKKVSSSSTLTLQGARHSHTPLGPPLSPTSHNVELDELVNNDSARPHDDDSEEDEDEEDEFFKKEEEEMRQLEEQDALERKLQDLARTMTKDAIGFVSSPTPIVQPKPKTYVDRERNKSRRHRQLSMSSASISSGYRPGPSRSQQSLSSMDSPHGSMVSPSPPSPPTGPARRPSHSHAHTYTESFSPPRPSMTRHFSPSGTSYSPPALSPRNALGHTHVGGSRASRAGGRKGGGVSEHGSEASSFSDMSDASVSASDLDSALSSHIPGAASRISSFAHSHLVGRRTNTRP